MEQFSFMKHHHDGETIYKKFSKGDAVPGVCSCGCDKYSFPMCEGGCAFRQSTPTFLFPVNFHLDIASSFKYSAKYYSQSHFYPKASSHCYLWYGEQLITAMGVPTNTRHRRLSALQKHKRRSCLQHVSHRVPNKRTSTRLLQVIKQRERVTKSQCRHLALERARKACRSKPSLKPTDPEQQLIYLLQGLQLWNQPKTVARRLKLPKLYRQYTHAAANLKLTLPRAKFLLAKRGGVTCLVNGIIESRYGIRRPIYRNKGGCVPLKMLFKTAKYKRFVVDLPGENLDVFIWRSTFEAAAELRRHQMVYEHSFFLYPDQHGPPHYLPPGFKVRRLNAIVNRRRCGYSCPAYIGYIMEAIRPLHKDHIHSLINKYSTKYTATRILSNLNWELMNLIPYMGAMQPRSDRRIAQVYNRPAYFDMIRTENEGGLAAWAGFMGAVLALLHWRLGLDGRGIQFQLGSDRHEATPKLWVTNFNGCKPFEETYEETYEAVESQLVPAVTRTAMWPRPRTAPSFRAHDDADGSIQNTWLVFITEYTRMSTEIMRVNGSVSVLGDLPMCFAAKLCKFWGDGGSWSS